MHSTVHSVWYWHIAQFTVCGTDAQNISQCGTDAQHSSQCVVLTHSTVHSVWYWHTAHFTLELQRTSNGIMLSVKLGILVLDGRRSQCVVLMYRTVHSAWYWCTEQFTVCGTDVQNSSQCVVLIYRTVHTGTPTNTQWHHTVSQTGHSCAAIRPTTQHVSSACSYAPDPSSSHIQLHTGAAGPCAKKPYSLYFQWKNKLCNTSTDSGLNINMVSKTRHHKMKAAQFTSLLEWDQWKEMDPNDGFST